MAEVSRDVPASALTMGNLDPVSVFKDSTPEQIYHDTTMLLEKMTEFPNFVLSSGCDTPPHTPMVNIDSFFKALYDFNNK